MQDLTRRRFLVTLGMLGGAAAVAPLIARADTPPAPPDTGMPVYWAKVGIAKDFPVGTVSRAVYPVDFGGGFAYVNRTTDKTITALSPKCTHHHCPVDFDATDKVFNCPCHHAQFSITGEHLSGPGHGPLAPLQAKIDDKDVVWIQSLTPPASG